MTKFDPNETYTITLTPNRWGRARFSIEPLPPEVIDTVEDSDMKITAWIVWNFLKDLESSI